MDAHRFEETLNAFKRVRPYRPFTIVMISGNRCEVDHPDAYLTRDGVFIYAMPGGIPLWFDHASVSEIIGDLSSTQEV